MFHQSTWSLFTTTVEYFRLDPLRISSLVWAAAIIWGAGALGTLFSFKELSRLERAGLRIAAGIAVVLTSCVLFHAVGHAAGLAMPHIEPDGSSVRPRGGVFSFGVLQLALLAIAGFAVDTCRFFRRRAARKSGAPPAKSGVALGLSVPRIHRVGPAALVLGTVLFWFAVFYNGAMSYVWLEDNDPWDHAWAVHWILESGSFYEPLVNHTDPRTGAPDPIQIFHYLDAYPPGFDIFLAIPALATHGDLVWVLKFYTCLLVALGLLMCYPTLVWFARIGISLAGSGRHAVAAEPHSGYREGQDERREYMSRWIGAIGVVVLSCVPGYPSRFIWSHPLALLLWAAAIAPLFRLGQGSQDRNYAWWEFVQPPPRVAAGSPGIQNSVTSGIGLGASLVVALFTFCGLGLFTAVKTIRRQTWFAWAAPTSDGSSMTSGRATPMPDSTEPKGDSVAGSAILALALMLAHSLIGLYGNRPSVPVQLFAFRYRHVMSFVAVFCTVVVIGWTITMMERSRRLAFGLCGAMLIPTVALVALASRPYIQVSTNTDGISASPGIGPGEAGASVWQLSTSVPLIAELVRTVEPVGHLRNLR